MSEKVQQTQRKKELKDEKQKNLKIPCRGFFSVEVEDRFVKNIQQTVVVKQKIKEKKKKNNQTTKQSIY